ncbi:MAG: hypothetical protein EOP67_12320 [Sphingomonas sp.]|jgi:hypothetical protein|nr:MAG: hypothetical protein EOP67_12320 [Sphingomonas sp.]
MHTITTDLETGIIEVDASGFWTIEHVEDFLRDLERDGRRVLATGKRHVLLCNFSKSAIQPQEVIAMLQRVAVSIPLKSRKVALDTEGKLARLPVKRISSVRDDMAVFDDRESALAWMLAEAPAYPDATSPPSS